MVSIEKYEAAWKWLDGRSAARERWQALLTWAALGIAILALIVSVLAWQRPVSPPG